jgi:ABC-2 type transport system ATP-binding protein
LARVEIATSYRFASPLDCPIHIANGWWKLGLLDARMNKQREASAALSVRRATHSYSSKPVLKDVSLTIRQGEIYALLGRNGAGKSTLLRSISGRQDLTSGTIRIGRKHSPREAAARGILGYVPQDIALYRHLTVRENLSFFGRMAGLSGRESDQAIAQVLESAALEAQADQIVSSLSGGYQRRVNIAAAALTRPILMVLDEPTVGIDIQAREAIHILLRNLRDSGVALILTTHDLEQAQVLSDNIGILDGGLLALEGEPQQLLQDAFGAAKEMIVELLETPDAHGADYLASLHLVQSQSPQMWTMLLTAGGIDVAAMSDHLIEQGLSVKEIRIRKPDLASLFVHVVGPEAAR